MQEIKSSKAINSLQGLNILIADDERLNYTLLSIILEETGANLFYVINGSEAIEVCKTHPIDLILMDIKMPILNGIDATREIKQFSDIIIIAVSANGNNWEELEKQGFDYFIPKPVSVFELVDQILYVLDKKRNAKNGLRD